MSTRKSSVQGLFYPDEGSDIEEFINYFNSKISQKIQVPFGIKALIVPHAGYIYSGYTANLAYKLASSSLQDIDRVVVIGPSHRVYLEGASVCKFEEYQTPLGNIPIDTEYIQQIEKKHSFLSFNQEAHQEHSTETQMPFIKHYFPKAKVVEIVYGKIESVTLANLVDTIIESPKTLLVISTDLSHFYNLEKAKELDDTCIEAIDELNMEGFNKCEACGIKGVKALVQSAKKHLLVPQFLDYSTSYERSKDANSVVGYTSFLFSKNINKVL